MDAHSEHLLSQHLLVITEKGLLKRINVPFKALLLVSAGELQENKIYLISGVFTGQDNIMVYVVRGNRYFYYYFIVIG